MGCVASAGLDFREGLEVRGNIGGRHEFYKITLSDVLVSSCRRLLDAEHARREVIRGNRRPKYLGWPPPAGCWSPTAASIRTWNG